MRLLLKVLAWLCVYFCGMAAFACLLALLIFTFGPRGASVSTTVWLWRVGSLSGFGVLALYGAWRMVRHLRRPDTTTARQVCVVALLLFAVHLIAVIHGRPMREVKYELFGTAAETLGSVAAGLAMVLLYQLVLKHLAARTFSSSDPKSHA
jgi:hypothetical protein